MRPTKAQLIAELNRLRIRLEALETLHENEEKYRTLLDESSDPIFMFYPNGQYRYVNKAFADGVGKPVEQIVGKKIWDVFPQEEADKRYTAVKWVFENNTTRTLDVRVPRPDGDRYYLTTVKPIANDQNQVVSVICISKEITERRRFEDALRQANERLRTQLVEIADLQASLREQAIRDPLTGLYNLRYLTETLGRELAQAARNQTLVSVVVMDIDHFKQFNDSYGHLTGDEVLHALGDILLQQTRQTDVACRYGGEEFVVIMPGADLGDAYKRAEHWRLAFENLRLKAGQHEIRTTLSAGIATFPYNSSTTEGLLRAADQALYAAKDAGRNRVMLANGIH